MLRIGHFAKITGVPIRTLRYYEKNLWEFVPIRGFSFFVLARPSNSLGCKNSANIGHQWSIRSESNGRNSA